MTRARRVRAPAPSSVGAFPGSAEPCTACSGAKLGPDIATHLALCFAAYREGLVEIEHGRRRPDGRLALGSRRRPGDYVPVGEADRAAGLVARFAAAGEEVFLGVLPRLRAEPDRRAVACARCLWVDIDSRAAFEAAEGRAPPAHLVVRSGSGGGHLYWLLAESVAPEQAERANRRLARHLRADPASCDRLRLLRAPGSPNAKAGRRAELAVARPGLARYLLADLAAGLPEPEERSLRALPPAAPLPRAADPLRAIAPAVWFERLTGRRPDRAGWARCPLHDDRAPSLRLYREPERGWCCYAGCGAGSVYDFAALFWFPGQYAGASGAALRGRRFVEVRERLMAIFFGEGNGA